MTKFEAIFLWAAVWMYGISFIIMLYSTVFKKEKWINIGFILVALGLILQSVSIGIRWSATGHPPVMKDFENSMLGSWFIVVLYLVIRFWQKRMEIIGVFVLPIVFMMIGNAVLGNPIHQPLSPPYKSNWLWLHVFFAWVAYGAFSVSAAMGFMYLIKERNSHKNKITFLSQRLPELPIMNDLILKIIIFGFIALTVEIGAGALWAHDLWGRYWGWDPIENWSLITWLTYGLCIHLALTMGWKGKRLAILSIIALFVVFITFGGIGYLGGVHTTIM